MDATKNATNPLMATDINVLPPLQAVNTRRRREMSTSVIEWGTWLARDGFLGRAIVAKGDVLYIYTCEYIYKESTIRQVGKLGVISGLFINALEVVSSWNVSMLVACV